ncbi:MAG: hypothetical protein R3C53_19675 [Pirellulaceae bacterium]
MSILAGQTEPKSLGQAVAQRDSSYCELHELTQQRLIQFRRRRSLLAFWRGIGIAVTVSVIALLGVVVLDAWVTHALVRPLGSVAFYLVALFGFGWFCLRPVLTPLNLLSEAIRFEQCDPRLVERLVPAVELAGQPAGGDSPAFRQQLQRQVAELVEPVRVRSLLPWHGVWRFPFIGLATAMTLLLLCLIPNLHLPHRLARMLLPSADLGRVSHLTISIEQPASADATVALDDLVAVIARIEGPRPELVTLETRADGSQNQLTMRFADRASNESPGENGEASRISYFETALPIGAPSIEYRVTSEGAESPWYRLTAKPRPRVAHFHKTIYLPEYADQPAVTLDEPHGDIEAYVGSRVKIELETNIPLAEARIEWLNSQDATMKPKGNTSLIILPSGRAAIEFTVAHNAEYRLHLIAKESGLTNLLSPTYHVTAVTDGPPQLTWIEPKRTSLVVSRSQLLALQLQIADELPVAALTQRMQINSDSLPAGSSPTAWRETPLPLPDAAPPGQSESLSWSFDLMPLNANPGDIVAIQVVAVDRNSNRTESPTLRLMISDTAIDIAETVGEQLRQTVAGNLEALAMRITESPSADLLTKESPHRLAVRELRESLEKTKQVPPTEEQIAQIESLAVKFAEEFNQHAQPIIEDIERAIVEAGDAVSEHELRITAALLSKLKHDVAADLKHQVQQLKSGLPDARDEQQAKQKHNELARRAASSMENALRNVAEIASDFRDMVSHDVISRYSQQFHNLSTAQNSIQQALADKSLAPEQARRQQIVLGRQLKELQQQLRQTTGTRTSVAERMQQVADEMNWLVDRIDSLQDNHSPQELSQFAEQLDGALKHFRITQRIDAGLSDSSNAARRRMNERAGAADDAISSLAEDLQNHRQRQDQAAAVAQQLSDRRMLNRTGSHGDREFASDLGNARRAITQITSDPSLSREEQISQLRTIEQSVATLSASSAVNSAVANLITLVRSESRTLDDSAARTQHPRLWETYSQSMEWAATELREARLPNEITSQLDQLRWNAAARRAGEKITKRLWDAGAPVSAASDLQLLADDLQQIQALLREHASAARDALAESTPSISELARQAADATQDVQTQTQSLSEEMKRDDVPDPQTRIDGLQMELAELSDPVGELRDALVDRADAQNLLESRDLQLASGGRSYRSSRSCGTASAAFP